MTYLHDIDPIALHLPTFELFGRSFAPSIHWYGLMYILGFVFAWWLGSRRIRAGRLPGVDQNGFGDLLYYCLLGVILGGRIGYILFYGTQDFLANPAMIFKVWEGGMSFHGGLLGVLFAAWLWSRKQKLHYFDVMDFIAPLVPVGLGLVRIGGNFVGGELWGKYTHAGWGVIFPRAESSLNGMDLATLHARHSSGILNALARHPTQIYEGLLEGLVMAAVLIWHSRAPRPRYRISGLFALMYGVFRFAVEFLREPDAQLGYLAFGWITMGQVLSTPLILIGLYWLWKSHSAPTLQPQPLPRAQTTDAA